MKFSWLSARQASSSSLTGEARAHAAAAIAAAARVRTRGKPASRLASHTQQRGAAIISALLVVALSAILVSGMLWRQQVQIRRIENQRLLSQAQWVARGALDWTRLILRSEGDTSAGITYLGGLWGVPIAKTRLSDFLGQIGEVRAEQGAATYLSGSIEDAQAKFNLRNLVSSPAPGVMQLNLEQIGAYQRLLVSLGVNSQLAKATAVQVRKSLSQSATRFQTATSAASTTSSASSTAATPAVEGGATGGSFTDKPGLDEGEDKAGAPLQMTGVESLLDIPGFTPELVARLRPFVTMLPTVTAVNMNTASAEVIAAVVTGMSLSAGAGVRREPQDGVFPQCRQRAARVARRRRAVGRDRSEPTRRQHELLFDPRPRAARTRRSGPHDPRLSRCNDAHDAYRADTRPTMNNAIPEREWPLSTLIVLLPPRDPAVRSQEWQLPELPFVLLDKSGRTQRAGRSALALLPRASSTVLMVAARDLLMMPTTLPPLRGPKLRQALPNIVEDQLIQDPQTCHIAVDPQPLAGGRHLLAIIDRGWFRFVCDAFTSAGHRSLRAVPVTRCLPQAAAHDTPVEAAELVSAGEPGLASLASVTTALPGVAPVVAPDLPSVVPMVAVVLGAVAQTAPALLLEGAVESGVPRVELAIARGVQGEGLAAPANAVMRHSPRSPARRRFRCTR